MRRPRRPATRFIATLALGASVGIAGCASEDTSETRSGSVSTPVTAESDSSDPSVPPSESGSTTASTTSTTSTSTTSTSTTTTTTTVPVPTEPGVLDLSQPMVGLGFSVEGRPIFAERYGTPGGRRVLVIGAIHGDEDDGLAIVDELRSRDVPDGVELWIVESMNPDGVANQDRHNSNEVDLNRNFPYQWGPIGVPGDSQYAGPAPASEPETQAIVNLISQLRPDIAIWYHQDLYVINPSQGREGRVRARYAELTGLPMGQITGGTYTGIAATWARQELADADGVAFIVELGATLSPEEAVMHADAVLTIGQEG